MSTSELSPDMVKQTTTVPYGDDVIYKDPKQHETVTYRKIMAVEEAADLVEKLWGYDARMKWMAGLTEPFVVDVKVIGEVPLKGPGL